MNATVIQDPLLTLFHSAKGGFMLSINEHTTSYWSVEEELKFQGEWMTDPTPEGIAIKEQMVSTNTMVAVRVYIEPGSDYKGFYGVTVKQACERALQCMDSQGVPLSYPGGDLTSSPTDQLQELGELCKAAVELTVNPQKQQGGKGQTANEYLKDAEEFGLITFDHKNQDYVEITPEVRKVMEVKDSIVDLQFYPNTPGGFYSLYGPDFGHLFTDAVDKVKQYREN